MVAGFCRLFLSRNCAKTVSCIKHVGLIEPPTIGYNNENEVAFRCVLSLLVATRCMYLYMYDDLAFSGTPAHEGHVIISVLHQNVSLC